MSSIQRHLPAAGFFLLLAIWLTWPQAALLGQAVVGGPIAEADGWQKTWNMWWVRQALGTLQNPLTTDLLFWPFGAPLGFQPIDLSNALLVLPVLLSADPLTGYGTAVLLGFTLTGLTTYILAWRVVGSRSAALLAGTIATAAPAHMVRFLDGQLEHVALHWTALHLLALYQASERGTLRSGIWLGLALALTAYTSWYHALFNAMLAVVWVGWQLAARRTPRHTLRPWLAAIPLVLVLCAPLLTSFAGGISTSSRDATHWQIQARLYSADLLDFLLPSSYHPWWGAPVAAYQQQLHPASAGWTITPGYLALLLALAGLVLAWRAARLWGLLALVLILFALGETLQIAGYNTGLPLPVASFFSAVPGLNFGHRRFIAATIALVPLAIAAACGLREIVRIAFSSTPQARQYALSALLLVGLLVEYAPPPLLVFRDDTVPLYATLRGGEGALLIVPSDPGGLQFKSASLRAQMTHGRPIAGGYVAREPEYPLIDGAPLIGRLERQGCSHPGIVADDPTVALAALHYYGFRRIVVDDHQLSRPQAACVRELLVEYGMPQQAQEGSVTIYDVPPGEILPYAYIGNGWWPTERDGDRLWRWMGTDATLWLVNTEATPRWFALTLYGQSYLHPRSLAVQLGGRPSGQLQIAPTISRHYTLLLHLPPGESRLQLSAPTDADQTREGIRQISVSIEAVQLRMLP
ncbi:MAG TPA: hypothetical protein PKA05_02395 [Roseiflexaceae bacterium]|mgnify:CR=1 FL=1|nr:hypothetical protein [Roseiflexaceae bacterium]HMP39204.1 hypothetical protein [Roseiflexaceae bacterium]